jgi:transcriptional regulator with XRE-family HTH domain
MREAKTAAKEQASTAKLKKLNALVESVCGIYARVARRLGVHRSFVSRVARGERRSEPVEDDLLAELKRVQVKDR